MSSVNGSSAPGTRSPQPEPTVATTGNDIAADAPTAPKRLAERIAAIRHRQSLEEPAPSEFGGLTASPPTAFDGSVPFAHTGSAPIAADATQPLRTQPPAPSDAPIAPKVSSFASAEEIILAIAEVKPQPTPLPPYEVEAPRVVERPPNIIVRARDLSQARAEGERRASRHLSPYPGLLVGFTLAAIVSAGMFMLNV